jgi:hypothetical protein
VRRANETERRSDEQSDLLQLQNILFPNPHKKKEKQETVGKSHFSHKKVICVLNSHGLNADKVFMYIPCLMSVSADNKFLSTN